MMLLKLPCAQKSPGDLGKMQIRTQSGVGPEILHFCQAPGDAGAVGPQTALGIFGN